MRNSLNLVLSALFFVTGAAFASEEDDLAEMQRQLNSEVLSQPFLAEQPEKVDAYIKESKKKGLTPEVYQGNHWRPGYTCRDMLRYNWTEYRNCRYYRSYYGRYYPYY